MVASIFRGCLSLSSSHRRDAPPSKTVEQAFQEAADGKEYLSSANLVAYVEGQGYELITVDQAQELIVKSKESSHPLFHHDDGQSGDGVNLAGFTKLLLNPDLNSALKPKQKSQDMTGPLSYYFVYTSHNSYLTGNQLTSKSSATPITDALKNGCRVIELDCWEKNGRIKVLHGGTLTKPVRFEDCLYAIKNNAFLASDYPVIITIENHLQPELQIEAAKILKDVFGDLLYIPNAAERPPLEFLSPEALKGRIIISDKPLREPVEHQVGGDPEGAVGVAQGLLGGSDSDQDSPDMQSKNRKVFPGPSKVDRKTVERAAKAIDKAQLPPVMPKAEEFEELLYIYCEKPSEMNQKQVKGGPLLSGDRAIMANLSEPQMKKFMKTHPGSVIEYTKRNLGRVYPFGLRFDSSNADPMSSWSHGCQMAALNLQGQDRPAWLGQGFFIANGGCGYVRKPEVFLRDSTMTYEDILNLKPKLLLKVKVILGTDWHKRFDLFKKPDFYVKVGVHGVSTDNLKKKTKVAHSTREPSWEDEEFEFPIRVPEIALLRFEVWEEDRMNRDDFVGQSCMPVSELRQGIRVVTLRSRKGTVRSSKILCQFRLEEIEAPVASG